MQYRIEKLKTADTSYAAQHTAGEKLAREMLSAALKVPLHTLDILRAENGKPYVSGHDIHFSVSHSGEQVLCAVHTAPVGADIQRIVPLRDRVVQRVCTPAEIAYIGKDPVRFAEVWTRKEAYAKLTGKGLAIGLKTIAVADESGLFVNIKGYRVVTTNDNAYVYSIVWEEIGSPVQ